MDDKIVTSVNGIITGLKPEEVGHNQAVMIDSKSNFWRSYLIEKRKQINKTPIEDNRYFMFEVMGLWSSLFSYIEWLSCFYYLKHDLSRAKNYIPALLQKAWGWETELSIIIWKAGRNPIAHIGQANSIHHYYGSNYKTHPAFVELDIANTNTIAGFSIGNVPDGYFDKNNAVLVTFYYAGIEPLLVTLSEFVSKKLEHLKDPQEANLLVELNNQILH